MQSNKTAFVAALFLMACSVNAHADQSAKACVPNQYFSLGGLGFSDDLRSIHTKYGKPRTTGTYTGEDDGGEYTGTRLRFTSLEVDIDHLRGVERISTENRNTSFALGVHVGMSLSEVRRRIRFVDNPTRKSHTVTLEACADGNVVDRAELRLHFSAAGKNESKPLLSQIEIVEYGP